MEFRKLIVPLLCVAAAAFLATQGMDLWDSGYIVGYSWRILNGEIPYRDFFFKGPPATLYLWAGLMKITPLVGQFYILKLINWCLFFLQIRFWVKGFKYFYRWEKTTLSVLALGGICFSVQFFPMYPWPTTDGLLFASIAFYLLGSYAHKKNAFLWPIIALMTVLSALTKQSFYPVPLLFLVATVLYFDSKKGLWLFLWQLFFLGIGILALYLNHLLPAFIAHTTGETTLSDLWLSGVQNYILGYKNLGLAWIPVGVIALLIIIYALYQKLTFGQMLLQIAIAGSLWALVYGLLTTFQEGARLLWCMLLIGMVSFISLQKKDWIKSTPLWIILGIAWCSSISLGYPFPVFMGLGLLLVFYFFVFEGMPKNYMPLFQWITACFLITGTVYHYQPYAERPLSELHYNLGVVSAKLEGIQTSKGHFEKMKELKTLQVAYPHKKYIFAPNIPIGYYAFSLRNPLPADWLLNWEIHRDPKTLLKIASQKENLIFVEKSFIKGNELFMPKDRADFSVVTDYIVRHFHPIKETQHFIVYNGSSLNAPLPQTSKTGTVH
ncbi:YccS family putative transporter [Flavobacterium stagni]|uniref:Glycosyltransferase RgtA/B/C/D-like domain-containing protein n=1 Tax=Flavobacterium stagni TaxID=2506421 RepID=A0A4Q1KB34_9FLAO|nr:hypothetical protein [Flavobacterium stagni]RXR23515.1 hypothetical protein EQG61_05990 [Flavobacterium stagni]